MNPNVPTVVQSDRTVPINLRQSGPTPVQMLIDTRVRKSPYWHLSMEAGCWRASVYNRMYHPRGYVAPEDGAVLGLNSFGDGRTMLIAERAVGFGRQLRDRGYETVAVDLSELLLGGGGIKCCTLELRR